MTVGRSFGKGLGDIEMTKRDEKVVVVVVVFVVLVVGLLVVCCVGIFIFITNNTVLRGSWTPKYSRTATTRISHFRSIIVLLRRR